MAYTPSYDVHGDIWECDLEWSALDAEVTESRACRRAGGLGKVNVSAQGCSTTRGATAGDGAAPSCRPLAYTPSYDVHGDIWECDLEWSALEAEVTESRACRRAGGPGKVNLKDDAPIVPHCDKQPNLAAPGKGRRGKRGARLKDFDEDLALQDALAQAQAERRDLLACTADTRAELDQLIQRRGIRCPVCLSVVHATVALGTCGLCRRQCGTPSVVALCCGSEFLCPSCVGTFPPGVSAGMAAAAAAAQEDPVAEARRCSSRAPEVNE